MAIQYPINKTLGALVKAFPKSSIQCNQTIN